MIAQQSLEKKRGSIICHCPFLPEERKRMKKILNFQQQKFVHTKIKENYKEKKHFGGKEKRRNKIFINGIVGEIARRGGGGGGGRDKVSFRDF